MFFFSFFFGQCTCEIYFVFASNQATCFDYMITFLFVKKLNCLKSVDTLFFLGNLFEAVQKKINSANV